MTVTGGENAYSAEVENILSIHPAVAAVALIGVPDPRWREPSKRSSSGAKGRQPGEAGLIAYCRTRLANYEVPNSIDVVKHFPLVPSGKVSKQDLRARCWRGSGRSVA
jgi:long-chain acyl-CoA synthetase